MDYNKIIIALVVVIVVMLAAGFLFLNPSHAKVDSRVIVTSNSTLHDGDTFAVKLTDLNNTPIANQAVNVTIIDANGGKNPQVVNTDANGYGSLQLNGLTPGEYTFNITYGGNENYTGCNFTQKITIEKPATSSNSNAVSSGQSSDWVDSNGVPHFYENGKEYVGSRDGQHMDIATSNYVREHGMA